MLTSITRAAQQQQTFKLTPATRALNHFKMLYDKRSTKIHNGSSNTRQKRYCLRELAKCNSDTLWELKILN
jgi:choline kinase